MARGESMMAREMEILGIDLSDDKQVKSFVAKFPTQEQPLDCRALDVAPARRTFWNKTTTATKPRARRRISSSSSCSDVDGLIADADVWRRWRIHEKIKLAFSLVYAHRLPGLIQFWAPINVDETKSSTTLSTSCQPFALDDLANPRLFDYRLFSTNYHRLPDQSVVDDPLATAFLTRFPQVVLDLNKIANKGSPLVNKAIDCGLTCLILLPVFHHPLRRRSYSTYSSSFVGVVECCINAPSLLQPLLWFLNLELKRVCLSTYSVQQRLTYEPSHGLSRAKDEIDKALKIVCESFRLNLAQVWIVDDSVSHVSTPSSSSSSPSLSPSPSPSSSLSLSSSSTTSSEDTHLQTKQPGKYLVKLCGYIGVSIACDADYDASLNYCDTCEVLPLKSEDSGLVGPTLASGKAFFCKEVNNLLGVRGLYGILFRRTKCSSLTLCLRSAHTGTDVHYGFEFLWPKNINHTILLESLLLMLKMCLPSFMFASGAQLGDELGVIDLGKSTATRKVSTLMILPGNCFSQTPQTSKKEDWQTPKLEKRKLSDLYDEESQTDSDDPDYDSDCPSVRSVDWHLAANCRGTWINIVFDISYTLADVKQKVEKEFNLDPGTYTMEYQLMGERFVIDTDGDLTSCIRRWKTYLRKSINKPSFGVHVLPYADQPHVVDK